jgi:tRNA/rRNA methyltransferase
VGAAPLLAQAREFKSVAEAVADCTLVVGTTSLGHRELQHPLRRLEYGARLLRRELGSSQAALLFGSEKFGLANEDLAHCHWLIRISTATPNLSMNLGQAVAVCLYELIRDAKSAGSRPARLKPANAGDLEQITSMLLDVLDRSGYINRKTAASTTEKVRRLVRRLAISDRDAAVVLGMLRQILWRIRENSE